MKDNYKKLKFKVILVVVVVVSVIAGLRLYDDIVSHEKDINEKRELIASQFSVLFKNKIEEVDSYLKARLNGIAKLDTIKNIEANNRDALYEKASFRFKVIVKENPNVTRLHILKPGSISFLRVHKPKKFGDYIGDMQPMLKVLDKTKVMQYGFAFGTSDKKAISYRVARALFNKNGKYIGMIAIVYDFKSDVEKINELLSSIYNINNFADNEILIKESMLTHKIHNKKEKNLHFDDYELTYDVKNKVTKYILNNSHNIKNEHINVNGEDYIVYKDYNLLKDYQEKNVGLVISIFNNTKDTQKHNKKIIQAILKPLVVLIVILALFNYLFERFIKDSIKMANRKNLILDAQENIIIVTDGRYIKETNNTFLDFFGFDSLENFSKKYDCICDRFLDDENNKYIQTINKDNILWSNLVINNKSVLHKALIEDNKGKKYIFKVTGERLKSKNNIEEVMVFSDISLLEKQQQDSLETQKFIQEQSKHAQMGEMIGNIAHQWRQPLSAISTSASGIQIQKDVGSITEEQEYEMLNNIMKNANFLSDTIDIFRDYIKDEEELKEVILQDILNGAINIIASSLVNNNIKLISDIDNSEPIKITMIAGELSQVIINIINNAKDILIENNIVDSFIKIGLIKEDNIATIFVEDNGGGINDDILPKIFDPYFTTKHQSQGTGLGLHISKEIVEKHLMGKIYVKNSKTGATFYIELPRYKTNV